MPSLLGNHTIAELAEMAHTFALETSAMADAYASGADGWRASDPTAFAAWDADYRTFLARYLPVAEWTIARCSNVGMLGPNGETDEPAWLHLLSAFKPSDFDTTSWDDLNRRWTVAAAAGHAPPPPQARLPQHMPQPTATDWQQVAFTAADTLDTPRRAAVAAAAAVIGGPPMPLWKKVAIGAGVALGLGVVVRVAK